MALTLRLCTFSCKILHRVNIVLLKVRCSYITRLPAVSTWNWSNRCVCFLATDREVILDLNLVFLSSVIEAILQLLTRKAGGYGGCADDVGSRPPAGTKRDVIFCFRASSVLHDLIPRILYHLLKLFLS